MRVKLLQTGGNFGQLGQWSLLVDKLLAILVTKQRAIESNSKVCIEEALCSLIERRAKVKAPLKAETEA